MSESPDTTGQAERDALLSRILPHVPFDGWSEAAFTHADPDGTETRRLFPNGPGDAIAHFADWADRAMEAAAAAKYLDAMRVRDRIALLVRIRLEALLPHREAVRLEAGWLGLRGPDKGARLLWRTADRAWRLAGDTSTDLNHYTKRGLLSGVIAATTLCWLADNSPDNQESWAFLDRRIDNVMSAGKLIGQAKNLDPSRLMEAAAAFAGRLRYRS